MLMWLIELHCMEILYNRIENKRQKISIRFFLLHIYVSADNKYRWKVEKFVKSKFKKGFKGQRNKTIMCINKNFQEITLICVFSLLATLAELFRNIFHAYESHRYLPKLRLRKKKVSNNDSKICEKRFSYYNHLFFVT